VVLFPSCFHTAIENLVTSWTKCPLGKHIAQRAFRLNQNLGEKGGGIWNRHYSLVWGFKYPFGPTVSDMANRTLSPEQTLR
jgi:hypothetical protein